MSKTIKLSIMIIMSLIVCSKGIAWSADILIAKDSAKTLQMEISLAATQFLVGEPVMLQVIIRNIGNEPIRLPGYTSPGFIDSTYLSYIIEGPKKPGNLYDPGKIISGRDLPFNPEKESFVLKQGEEKSSSYILDECRIMVQGHYNVNIVLNIPQIKALIPPFFEGKLFASLEFDVLRPLGEDAAFLETMQKWFKVNKIPPENRCYYFLHRGEIDCTDRILRNQLTSRIASWLLIEEIMYFEITNPKEAIKNPKHAGIGINIFNKYICDPSYPDGKKDLPYTHPEEDMKIKLQWNIKTIDDILSRHPSAPFSASLEIQRAINIIALGDEAKGLKLLEKFIRECNDRKIVSRECNWAKEFAELWAQKKQTK